MESLFDTLTHSVAHQTLYFYCFQHNMFDTLTNSVAHQTSKCFDMNMMFNY